MSKYDGIEDISKASMTKDLGMLVDMVKHRLSTLSELDSEVIAKRLVSYIAMCSIEGGDLTPPVMTQIYSTTNDICHGGIVVPERYKDK